MHHTTPLVTGPTALSCGQYTAKSPIGRMTEDRSQRRAEQLPRPDYSGSLATHIATGETAVVRPLLNFSAASRVRRCRLLARRPSIRSEMSSLSVLVGIPDHGPLTILHTDKVWSVSRCTAMASSSPRHHHHAVRRLTPYGATTDRVVVVVGVIDERLVGEEVEVLGSAHFVSLAF